MLKWVFESLRAEHTHGMYRGYRTREDKRERGRGWSVCAMHMLSRYVSCVRVWIVIVVHCVYVNSLLCVCERVRVWIVVVVDCV
jgi:hypothetical protein